MTKKERFIQMLKFLGFSLSAGLIQIASFELLQLLSKYAFKVSEDQNYWFCYLISLTLSVLWNFTFNRKFTFKSATNVPVAMLKVFGYYLVFTPLSLWWGAAMESVGVNDTIVLLFTMVINFVTEYLFDSFVVFRDSNTKKTPEKSSEKQNEHAEAATNDEPDNENTYKAV